MPAGPAAIPSELEWMPHHHPYCGLLTGTDEVDPRDQTLRLEPHSQSGPPFEGADHCLNWQE